MQDWILDSPLCGEKPSLLPGALLLIIGYLFLTDTMAVV